MFKNYIKIALRNLAKQKIYSAINILGLAVGRASTRSLEVGMRKVLGAERRQLIHQFWGEFLVITIFKAQEFTEDA